MFGAAREAPRYWERAAKESNVGDFVSIGAPASPHDTVTRAGDDLRVWRLEGVPFESAEPSTVQDATSAVDELRRALGDDGFEQAVAAGAQLTETELVHFVKNRISAYNE